MSYCYCYCFCPSGTATAIAHLLLLLLLPACLIIIIIIIIIIIVIVVVVHIHIHIHVHIHANATPRHAMSRLYMCMRVWGGTGVRCGFFREREEEGRRQGVGGGHCDYIHICVVCATCVCDCV